MRLIDANSLLLRMEKRADCEPVGHFRTIKRMMKMVEQEPTVDPVKHGKWINGIRHSQSADADIGICSVCGNSEIGIVVNVEKMNAYCRMCGAKMDLEDDNEAD